MMLEKYHLSRADQQNERMLPCLNHNRKIQVKEKLLGIHAGTLFTSIASKQTLSKFQKKQNSINPNALHMSYYSRANRLIYNIVVRCNCPRNQQEK